MVNTYQGAKYFSYNGKVLNDNGNRKLWSCGNKKESIIFPKSQKHIIAYKIYEERNNK